MSYDNKEILIITIIILSHKRFYSLHPLQTKHKAIVNRLRQRCATPIRGRLY